MKYGKYAFHIKFTDDAGLPAYKGSTFRGILGHALKRTVCALKNRACPNCILRTGCTYALAFETAHALPGPDNARVSAPPHPMVLEPPLTEKTLFSKGETLCCHLVLFGDINRNLPYFIYAFDQMEPLGMGRKIKGRRAGFTLESVEHEGNLLYRKPQGDIHMPGHLPRVTLEPGTTNPVNRVTLTLHTPLRIQADGKGRPDLPFSLLVRSLVRRCTSLINTFGPGEPALDYPGLIQEAETVRITDNGLSWFDWQRYSARQDRKMFMGGLTGRITYQGNLAPFMPFLSMAETVHAGKNTAFGLGKVTVEASL